MGHIPRSRIDTLNRGGVTEGRVAELIVAGTLSGMKQVYDQLAEENRAMLLEMEGHVVERVLRTFEERTLRWRLARWWNRTFASPPVAVLLPTPTVPDTTTPVVEEAEPDDAVAAIDEGVRNGVIEIVKR